MATTNEILESVRSRLAELPLSAEFWPEEEKEYRLNHPVGAVLVGYAGASYGPSRDTFAVIQTREITLAVILVFRQLNGPDGAGKRAMPQRAGSQRITPGSRNRNEFLHIHLPVFGLNSLPLRLSWYELTLTCAGVLVEAMEEEDKPVLTDIDFEGGAS